MRSVIVTTEMYRVVYGAPAERLALPRRIPSAMPSRPFCRSV